MVEDRIAALESRADTLERRLRRLEGTDEPVWVAPPPLPPAMPMPPLAPRPRITPSPPPAPKRPERDIEDFLGGNVLAWVGGFAVLAGLAFLLTMAISRGWLGEGARTLLAAGVSLGMLGVGVWLREHRDRTEAAVVAAAVGIAGLFGTLVVAGPVYELVPQAVALLGAFATGAVGVALAIRWRTQVYGWLGLLGALTAPFALGALDGGGIVFLAIAFAATVAVLVWQRWTALAVVAFVVTTLQWLGWLLIEQPTGTFTTLTLVAFGALTTLLALGFEVNRPGLHRAPIGPRPRLRPHPFAIVLVVSAALLAITGWELLDGEPWLVALAAAHMAAGVAAAHVRRISREVALGILAIGIVLADLALASMASGLPLVVGWALSALPFAALLGARTGGSSRVFDRILGKPEDENAERVDRVLAMAGLLGQMTLAAGQTLIFDARPEALAGPAAPMSALLAAAAFAVVAWAAARLVRHPWRTGLDAVALASVAHLTGLALEGAALTAMFAAEALALGELARRRKDRYAAWAAVAFAGIGVVHAIGTLATPDALLYGLDAPLAAAAALGASAIALALVARTPLGIPGAPRILSTAAALTLLYLASVEVVTLGGEDTGQTLLSVLWAVTGVAALIRGLLVDDGPLRRAALVFIAVTATKVFLYDLSALDSMYRVGSLIGFGILLLFGAFAYQRVRPAA